MQIDHSDILYGCICKIISSLYLLQLCIGFVWFEALVYLGAENCTFWFFLENKHPADVLLRTPLLYTKLANLHHPQ